MLHVSDVSSTSDAPRVVQDDTPSDANGTSSPLTKEDLSPVSPLSAFETIRMINPFSPVIELRSFKISLS